MKEKMFKEAGWEKDRKIWNVYSANTGFLGPLHAKFHIPVL